MNNHYDTIVLGCGAMGSGALWRLATRGQRVLGLEQFGLAHDRGSSHGQTRIIRHAYFEHPDYVPLLVRAYSLWEELSSLTKQELVRWTGLLQVGAATGDVISGIQRTAEKHRLPVELLSSRDVERRFRAFRVDDGMVGLFEARAGFLRVEACVQAMLDAAVGLGAHVQFHEAARRWTVRDGIVEIETDRSTYRCDRLVIAAGAWATAMLQGLGLRLEVLRKPQLWYRTTTDALAVDNGCPAFLYETAEGIFYGFPQLDERGIKVAEHTGGSVVDDPSRVNRNVTQADRRKVEDFTQRWLNGVSLDCTDSNVCMYTMTPDTRFIIDLHPRWRQVSFVAGLSGHGFKFAPVLGEALADLATEGATSLEIGFLSADRSYLS